MVQGDMTADQSPLPSRVISSRRVFPATQTRKGQATVTKLSVIDATVVRFGPCAAVWLYEQGEAPHNSALFLDHLELSLRQTLDSFPHFAGQVRWATKEDEVRPREDADPRYLGRPVVSYGSADDPGVGFVLAEYDRDLSDVVPGSEERKTTRKVWVATEFPQGELLPGCDLAFGPGMAHFEGLPGVAVQITKFRCGGFAVGVTITHCLADALCLLTFVHSWAEHSRLLFEGSRDGSTHGQASRPMPVFDPELLDRHAGLTRGTEPDAAKVEHARSLPMHRFDWWAKDAPGYPPWAEATTLTTKPGDEELQKLQLSPSTFPPWQTWNPSAPVDHVQIRFGADEVVRMKQAAQATISSGDVRISRLDAVLAHMWVLINRARRLQDTAEPVYMNITLGLRSRVQPPLPDGFLGSPILLGHISQPGSEVSPAANSTTTATTIGSVALSIREMMTRFTPEAVGAHLHDAAHEVSPQRLWQAFLGERHTIVTSWTRAGAYEVDFVGSGVRPRYVQGKMPRMDGVLQVMDDVAETGDFDVSLCMEREATGRLLGDGMLRAYER
ncbi:hypothetical protein VMCG_10279 [Cytospora schulzeri]|uniref:Transferase n=1 Tax=Cytospora schulzeri TaxID=448051 RepID=A0A423VAJ9_9PEZI|nr:hypothetical protein VMCG_10279 [Valsa malicola]